MGKPPYPLVLSPEGVNFSFFLYTHGEPMWHITGSGMVDLLLSIINRHREGNDLGSLGGDVVKVAMYSAQYYYMVMLL